MFVEPFRLEVTTTDISTPKWGYKKPVKIALISDPHEIEPWMSITHLQTIVDKANEQNPDIVFLLGDYVAGHPFGKQINPKDGVQPYKNLKAPCGVFAILGNHDFHGPVGWPQALATTGIPILENKAHEIECQGQKFWVAGLDERWWGKPSIPNTMKQITDDKPIIMLIHNPDFFPELDERITLSIAGHTHGGQIRIPFWGAVGAVVPSKYGAKYAYGHYTEGQKDLFVTRGLGETGIPVRFNCVPELAILNLQSPK